MPNKKHPYLDECAEELASYFCTSLDSDAEFDAVNKILKEMLKKYSEELLNEMIKELEDLKSVIKNGH